MPEKNLKFNPETMNYEMPKKNRRLLRNIIYILAMSIAFGVAFILILINVVKSPEERKKEYDLKVYKETYEDLSEEFQKNLEGVKNLEKKDKELFQEIFEAEQEDSTYLSDNILKDEKGNTNNLDFSNLVSKTSSKFSDIKKKMNKEIYLFQFANYFVANNKEYIKSLPINMPLKEKTYNLVSGFGERIHPIFKTVRQHNGIDFAARAGTPIYASGDGIVEEPPEKLAGYGTVIIINHGNGIKSVYAQLLDKKVKTGQRISAGEQIGFVGNTGISIGPHLHYEIWINGKAQNPMNFIISLPTNVYNDMLKKAAQFNQCMS